MKFCNTLYDKIAHFYNCESKGINIIKAIKGIEKLK